MSGDSLREIDMVSAYPTVSVEDVQKEAIESLDRLGHSNELPGDRMVVRNALLGMVGIKSRREPG